jgi:hypothetical protein
MGAFVEHKFKRAFLLNEERIRKLRDIVDTRLNDIDGSLKLSYKVYRGDTHSYVTENIDDVIAEDNEDWRRITRLDVLVKELDLIDFLLTFRDDGVRLTITGDDRDKVFLLFSDVRDYIQNEITTCSRLLALMNSKELFLVAVPIITLLAIVPLLGLLSLANTDKEETARILASNDIEEKLNFIIAGRDKGKGFLYLYIPLMICIPIGMVLFAMRMPQKLSRFFFPTNDFLFGDRKERFERRKETNSKIFWGVFVASIIGLITGVAVWWFTTKPN